MTELVQSEACLKLFFLSFKYFKYSGGGISEYWQLNALFFFLNKIWQKGVLVEWGEGRQADVASYLMGLNSKVGGSRDAYSLVWGLRCIQSAMAGMAWTLFRNATSLGWMPNKSGFKTRRVVLQISQ